MKTFASFLTAVAALVLISTPTQAQRSAMCSQAGDGRFQLHFTIKPSLVVHSNAVMDATRGDLGLDGEASERAFSFRRTIKAILESANGPADEAAQIAFVRTMLDSFRVPTGKALNAAAGVLMPFDNRAEADKLIPEQMLDESSPQAMKPLALFNRFDLAPDNWAHCGEHRIVYGKQNPDPFPNRMLLIFEAMVPNPQPSAGEAGCRRVAEFWAGLSGADAADDLEKARRLSAFFYEGKTGHADGDLVDPATNAPAPVVSFRNYGGDGGRGQVRANAFMQLPWQLREWLTQLTFSETGPAVAFVPVTVKDNPLAELYRDDLSTVTNITNGNVAAAVTNLHGQFIQSLTSGIALRLLSETTDKHRLLADELEQFDLGSGPPVSEETILFSTIALGNEDKFNEHQSVSQGGEDVPGIPAGTALTVTALLDQVGAFPSQPFPRQSGQTILNRALASTCGGCHMTAARSAGFFGAPGVVVREKADGTELRWPDVDPGGFVHVNETTRALSPALEQFFLPVRRYILGRHLCAELEGPVVAGGPEPWVESYALALGRIDLPVETVASKARYLDEVVSSYMTGARKGTQALTGRQPMSAKIASLNSTERAALRVKVAEVIDAARQIELLRPGAFVETRRPH